MDCAPRATSPLRLKITACAAWLASSPTPIARPASAALRGTSARPQRQVATPALPAGYRTASSRSASRALLGASLPTEGSAARAPPGILAHCSATAARAQRVTSLACVTAVGRLRASHLPASRRNHASRRDRATAALPAPRQMLHGRSASHARTGTSRGVATISASHAQLVGLQRGMTA